MFGPLELTWFFSPPTIWLDLAAQLLCDGVMVSLNLLDVAFIAWVYASLGFVMILLVICCGVGAL